MEPTTPSSHDARSRVALSTHDDRVRERAHAHEKRAFDVVGEPYDGAPAVPPLPPLAGSGSKAVQKPVLCPRRTTQGDGKTVGIGICLNAKCTMPPPHCYGAGREGEAGASRAEDERERGLLERKLPS